jgi:hypothetical protein
VTSPWSPICCHPVRIPPNRRDASQPSWETNGAKEEAVDFYRRTQTFLILFRESGKVDVGIVLDPWLANNNTRAVLLNGAPRIFEPGDSELPADARRDPDYQLLKSFFPNLDAGVQFPLFESARRDDERPGYVFQFYLEDGCHACDTGFRARVIFRMGPGGTLGSVGSLGICSSRDIIETPSELSHIPACPSPHGGGGRS